VRLFLERFLAGVLITLAMPVLAGAKSERREAQARLLDQNQYICSNCLFGASDYYACFEADNRILIGYQKIPQVSWMDHSSNLLTRAHKSYLPWVAEGQTVGLSYDDKFIYVKRPSGKLVKLRQNYHTDIFIHDAKCRAAVKKQPN
jgi:hypothetical protein